MDDIDNLLRRAAPDYESVEGSAAAIDTTINQARQRAVAQRESHRRRAKVLLPLGVAALALTGGAALFVPYFGGDVRIPIEYVTDTGVAVSCVYVLGIESNPDSDNEAMRSWAKEHNWDGVGQRIYDDALAGTYMPEDVDDTWPLEAAESASWASAMKHHIIGSLPRQLRQPGDGYVGTSDCFGQLH